MRGRFYLIVCSILSCLCAFPICTLASDTIHIYVSSRDTIRHIAVRNVYDGDTLPVRFHGTYRNVRVWNKQEGDTLRHFIIPRKIKGKKVETIYVIPYTGDDRLGPPEIQVKKKRSWFYRLFKSSGK